MIESMELALKLKTAPKKEIYVVQMAVCWATHGSQKYSDIASFESASDAEELFQHLESLDRGGRFEFLNLLGWSLDRTWFKGSGQRIRSMQVILEDEDEDE